MEVWEQSCCNNSATLQKNFQWIKVLSIHDSSKSQRMDFTHFSMSLKYLCLFNMHSNWPEKKNDWRTNKNEIKINFKYALDVCWWIHSIVRPEFAFLPSFIFSSLPIWFFIINPHALLDRVSACEIIFFLRVANGADIFHSQTIV